MWFYVLSFHKSFQDYLLDFCKFSYMTVSYKDNFMVILHQDLSFLSFKTLFFSHLYLVLHKLFTLGTITDCNDFHFLLAVCHDLLLILLFFYGSL